MCLGIPGQVVEIYQEHGVGMGKGDLGGISKRVRLEHVLEVRPHDYVIIHVGSALSVVDEAEARQGFASLAVGFETTAPASGSSRCSPDSSCHE